MEEEGVAMERVVVGAAPAAAPPVPAEAVVLR